MPRDIEFYKDSTLPTVTKPVATEAELLEFCNRVREAGGADVLESLLPSRSGSANRCLIANALNFGCNVIPSGDMRTWVMLLPRNLSDTQMAAIAEAVGAPVQPPDYHFMSAVSPFVRLPEHIGNAAEAFDLRLAFNEYQLTNG